MSGHLSDVDLYVYCRNAASEGVLLRIHEHLPECAYCSQRVSDAVKKALDADQEESQEPQSDD